MELLLAKILIEISKGLSRLSDAFLAAADYVLRVTR
jgi:hypothetical protein